MRTPSGSNSDTSNIDWGADGKEAWLPGPAAEAEDMRGLPAVPLTQPPLPPPPASLQPSYLRESSTDASGEDIPSLSDVRASGSSLDSGGGAEDRDGGGSGPLRIWIPLSRDISDRSKGGFSSPTRSAESDADLPSPIGFWHEKFETIDARNATRRFSGWGDNGSGEETSPRAETSRESGEDGREGGWEIATGITGSGRPPRQDIVQPGALRERDQPDPAGMSISVTRKLFASTEEALPPRIKANTPAKASLEPMAEGLESPYPTGPPGGEPHPPPFWAATTDSSRDSVGGGGSGGGSSGGGAGGGGDEKEAGGRGWRRGDAGLVVPEPRSSKPRSVTIQQVFSQRARIGDTPSGTGESSGLLPCPRPATTSPTLPASGELKSKTPKEIHALSQGVKITRSYSYHGLGSMALYDSASRG